jgi:DNA-binding protein H-NS
MSEDDLNKMPLEQLWLLHQKIALILARRIEAEKAVLDARLQQLELRATGNAKTPPKGRRPYPQVFPKFRNPANPAETWSGRGKQPRWIVAHLKSGKKLDYFRIEGTGGGTRRLLK